GCGCGCGCGCEGMSGSMSGGMSGGMSMSKSKGCVLEDCKVKIFTLFTTSYGHCFERKKHPNDGLIKHFSYIAQTEKTDL
ncbi:MAG: hypothetical protein JXB19_11790, partial [Bacteroidales bacterium]|nr:hypothetical protein [Bacteroidales bacterium]